MGNLNPIEHIPFLKNSSWNHRMGWIGRHLKDDLLLMPCLWQGHLPLAQGQKYHQHLSSC